MARARGPHPVPRAGRLRLISEETEVYPGIHVYPIGGHCPGELLTRIETAGGGLILSPVTLDYCFSRYGTDFVYSCGRLTHAS